MRVKRGFAGAACVLVFTFQGMANTPAPTGEGLYYFANAPLTEVLDLLSEDFGVDFSVEGVARQRVRDLEVGGQFNEILERVSRATDMDVFAFNGMVHVSPQSSREVRLVRLGDVSVSSAWKALEEAGLIQDRFDVSEVAGGGALVMSGPVKYLAIAESVVATLESDPEVREPAVRIRRGGRLEVAATGVAPVAAEASN